MNARSLSYDDVAFAVSQASAGDTIQLPESADEFHKGNEDSAAKGKYPDTIIRQLT